MKILQSPQSDVPSPEPWLRDWILPLLQRHSEIEQVYILGNKARGPHGQKPDYSLLLYAGYDQALDLMVALAREEEEWRTTDGIIHLYIENYGATFCGIWGGALIPNELNRKWEEAHDFVLWVDNSDANQSAPARSLAERLRLPVERRQGERRQIVDDSTLGSRDQLQPLWAPSPTTLATESAERRRDSDRRRDYGSLVPLLDQAH